MNQFDALYRATLDEMNRALTSFMEKIPQPQPMLFGGLVAYRFKEHDLLQAIVQKLARVISGLSATSLLLNNGYLQEHGAIQRMLDEFQEDIAFLSFAAIDGQKTDLHLRYLAAFYEEEFESSEDPLASRQKREMIPRKKIRAYMASRKEYEPDPSTGAALLNTVGKAYSGYVHAASPHVMEMYGGNPPRFHTGGMRDSPLFLDHQHDIWNYYYRGILTFGIAANAFYDKPTLQRIMNFLKFFEERSGSRKIGSY